MRELLTTSQFKKDLKRAKKRGKNRDKLGRIVEKIVADEPLAPVTSRTGCPATGLRAGNVILSPTGY